MIRAEAAAIEPAKKLFYCSFMVDPFSVKLLLIVSVTVNTMVLYGVTPIKGERQPLKKPPTPSPVYVSIMVLMTDVLALSSCILTLSNISEC